MLNCKRQHYSILPFILSSAGFLPLPSAAATIPVSISSDAQPSQPVGAATNWTAAVPSASLGLQVQFSVQPVGGAVSVLRSFHSSNTFEWAPMDEGSYQVIATVRDKAGNTGEARTDFLVTTRLSDPNAPTISSTQNPLVALYSSPACGSGSMRVMFYPAGSGSSAQYTSPKDCGSGNSLNFLVAGMLPNSAYILRSVLSAPDQPDQMGPEVAFETGSIDGAAQLAAAIVANPADAATDVSQPVLLTSYVAVQTSQSANPVATDLNGQVVWYYDRADQPLRYLIRPLEGGTMFVLPKDETLLRQIDLAGNTIRETNAAWISEQVQALYGMPAVTSFHHDAIVLPNGSIAAIVSMEKIFADIQSAPLVDLLGDAIIVMDPNFNVKWAWNGFDKLDVKRMATLNDTCAGSNPGCPPVLLAASIRQPAANDWMHSNALEYLPDGNFLLSMRSQDWLIKIDYRDGAGTGNVLWRMGQGGDFKVNAVDPQPWFSHQHSAVLDNGTLWLFDNGNTRRAANAAADSRGQVLQVDEAARTVSLLLNADLGNYSSALGSAERLDNGDFHFMSGFVAMSSSQSIEVVPNPAPGGAIDFLSQTANPAYRSFRMHSLSVP